MRSSIWTASFATWFFGAASARYGITGLPGSYLIGSFSGVPLVNESYDSVVVGGGTAGLVVATRLAENLNETVAVIEAGASNEYSNGNQSQIPFYSTKYVSADPTDVQPLIDWGLVTIPQPQLDNQVIHYAQEKCIGGSPARNQLIYHRRSSGSYDAWAEQVGDDAFARDHMLQYFQKSVNFTTPNRKKRPANATMDQLFNTSAYSPAGGPLHVFHPNGALGISSCGQQAFTAAGFPASDGFSGGVLNGSQWTPFTVDPENQQRSSSGASLLQDSLYNSRLNLKVCQSTQAMIVVFSDHKTTTGVNVSTAGYPYMIKARKEVILSAGAFHSPQLLIVSSVGPAETLGKYNISVVKDLPDVGQNTHDTTNAGGVTFPVNTLSTSAFTDNATLLAKVTHEYATNQTGILGLGAGDYIGWEKFPASYRASFSAATQAFLDKLPADSPEVEYAINGNARSIASGSGDKNNYATIGVLLVSTASRRKVTIASGSMLDMPVISVNWLFDKRDQVMAVQAYRRAREIWSPFDPSVKISPEHAPGADVTGYAEILKYVTHEAVGAIHHATSTGMMGRANPSMAVVDSRGQVFGVQNLRIIDSSSFAFTPPGHTQGATYAHAEKLVDDIINGR
ncbi:hypothetical protein B2J93_3628 [Marssonina coronariae]|uniref:Glucose-methanol-choline oxidoreductase N-terminal domain-containing protein n=1 Tax=Diplocarpon coronariae TaxID=2795749 RepID=A0A218Z5G8_9HELO|nr:hypothetical protein B2J93_3628 [Marssonina coronariae]